MQNHPLANQCWPVPIFNFYSHVIYEHDLARTFGNGMPEYKTPPNPLLTEYWRKETAAVEAVIYQEF